MSDQHLILPPAAKIRLVNQVSNLKTLIVFDEGRAGETSDGYHTFDDLYKHRMVLTAALCRALPPEQSWRSKNHHPDGDPMFDGFFIVGIELPDGLITYHYKLDHWYGFAGVREIKHAPAWDGHTPEDVLTRLAMYAGTPRKEAE